MSAGKVIVTVGVFILLIGLAMPTSQTHHAQTCYDDPTGFGQSCAQTSVETANPARGGVIGFGFFLTLIGGIVWAVSDDSSNGVQTASASTAEPINPPERDQQSNTVPERDQQSNAAVDDTHTLRSELRQDSTESSRTSESDAEQAASRSTTSDRTDWDWESK